MDADTDAAALQRGSQRTAPVTLELATARTLVQGLEMFGIGWSPGPFEMITATAPGLYAWVPGLTSFENVELLDRPVLYVGIGKGTDGGLPGRLKDETEWITADAAHSHGRAMYSLQAKAIGGPVYGTCRDLRWLSTPVADQPWWWSDSRWEAFRTWLTAAEPSMLEKAEQLSIRIAAHIGYTAPPVNSKHASAWATDAEADWGGWVAAQRLITGRIPA